IMGVTKVYGVGLSTCTARALACLVEKEVEYELVPLNLMAGEHKQPPFLAKNPFGQIPVLEDDEVTLFESRAITAYVANKYKGQGTDLLRHGSTKEIGLVGNWIEVEAHHFNPVVSPIVQNLVISPVFGKPVDQAAVDENVPKLAKVLDVYEARLSESKYLAGDFFSLADLNHFPYMHYLMKTEVAALVNSRPHVKAWWEAVSSRPSFKTVAVDMTMGD
ncbi:glutathione binding-like protein, partial [Ralstonia pseudosolanacearum]